MQKSVPLAYTLLEYKCISTIQHKFLIINCLNLMKIMTIIEAY